MPSKHICARWDMMPRSVHSTTTRLNIVLSGFIGPSLEQKLFLYQGNVTYSSWLWLILIQNVVQFSRICILRSDEKIPSRIRCVFQLIWSSGPGWVRPMSHDTLLFVLSDSFIYRVTPIERIDYISHNFSGIPVAKYRRNRVVGFIVNGTNRKETLFFTFNMFHRKIALGRRHCGSEKWNEGHRGEQKEIAK